MEYVKGERVRHPKKPEWGLGEVVEDSTEKSVTVFFEHEGEKKLATQYVKLVKVAGGEAVSSILDGRMFRVSPDASETGKPTCGNCGDPTTFAENADRERVRLGWCEPCFRHSQRTFVDFYTRETRYLDELRTIDGIRSRWSPK